MEEQQKIKNAEDVLAKNGISDLLLDESYSKVLTAMEEYASQFKPLSLPIQQDKIKEIIEWCEKEENSIVVHYSEIPSSEKIMEARLDEVKLFIEYLQSLSVPVL